MKELIAFLLLWIGAETNYNVNLETPRVVQLTQQELNTMYYTEDTHPSGHLHCLLYTSPSPRDREKSRMPSSA